MKWTVHIRKIDRTEIIDDVRLWSKHYLEVPNLHLGGVPACPFAKKTWYNKKAWVSVKTKGSVYKTELSNHLKNLNFNVSEILIFCDPYYSYLPNDLHEITEEFNKIHNKKDLYFMSFHPQNPATEEEQKFSQLMEASDKLHRQGYYKQWPNGYYRDVVISRAEKYNKIIGGLS